MSEEERKTETHTIGAIGAAGTARVRVKIVGGEERVLERGGSVVVGAGLDVDLPINDARLSRRHVQIALVQDGVRITDLGSKNGTRVNGVAVQGAVTVSDGARIAVGGTEIVVEDVVDAASSQSFGGLSTKNAEMSRLFGLLARVAPGDVTVLLEGETGTGKDVLARAIHRESARARAPFVVVDCGSLAPTLVQSELFGHKKGAFTGATADHAGVFEAAAGGTVFLDEIGELALDLQPTLLRVLENREVRRLGETKARAVDVRVIAATHRDLKARVDAGAFRSDLYFRLAVVRAHVPPLRARREDIPALAAALLRDLGRDEPLADDIARKLSAHHWPGNVRELRNVLAAGHALSRGPLTIPELDHEGGAGGVRDERQKSERAYLEGLLKKHAGNVTHAAKEAGVDRKHLHRLIARHGIDAKRYR